MCRAIRRAPRRRARPSRASAPPSPQPLATRVARAAVRRSVTRSPSQRDRAICGPRCGMRLAHSLRRRVARSAGAWLALDPARPLDGPLAVLSAVGWAVGCRCRLSVVCCLRAGPSPCGARLARPLLTQRPMDRTSPPQPQRGERLEDDEQDVERGTAATVAASERRHAASQRGERSRAGARRRRDGGRRSGRACHQGRLAVGL
jgi:hypothetical protein